MRDEFIDNNIINASLDARLLARFALNIDEINLALSENNKISKEQYNLLQNLAKRRIKGEPIARILSQKEFYGLNFKLNSATLIPRPETEILVDLALKEIKKIKQKKKIKILELGTGSGCILISILKNSNNTRCIGTDIAQEALNMAKENAIIHQVQNFLELRLGSWFEPIGEREKFDLIISNPPYIESDKINFLAKEVRNFDPIIALDGGKDGLEPYRIIAREAKKHLKEKAKIIIEFGLGQEDKIFEIFNKNGFAKFKLIRDLSNINRAFIFQKVKHFSD